MRIGMVCPYSFDVAGGVQAHVLQLAEVMRARGHHVSVLAPASRHVELPDYVVSAGKAVAIPYNGSVARLKFGPATLRKVRKWLAALSRKDRRPHRGVRSGAALADGSAGLGRRGDPQRC